MQRKCVRSYNLHSCRSAMRRRFIAITKLCSYVVNVNSNRTHNDHRHQPLQLQPMHKQQRRESQQIQPQLIITITITIRIEFLLCDDEDEEKNCPIGCWFQLLSSVPLFDSRHQLIQRHFKLMYLYNKNKINQPKNQNFLLRSILELTKFLLFDRSLAPINTTSIHINWDF